MHAVSIDALSIGSEIAPAAGFGVLVVAGGWSRFRGFGVPMAWKIWQTFLSATLAVGTPSDAEQGAAPYIVNVAQYDYPWDKTCRRQWLHLNQRRGKPSTPQPATTVVASPTTLPPGTIRKTVVTYT